MSAKLRLTLWFTLMVLLMAAMVLVFVLVINAHSITDDPAERLVHFVLDNADDLEFDHGRFEWHDVDVRKRGLSCTFYSEDGAVLMSAETEGVHCDLPFEPNILRTVATEAGDYYVYDVYVDMDVTGVWLRGLASTSDRSGVMHTILVLTATLLPALIVISLGGGWLIACNTFKPVEKIVSVANEISDGDDLTKRVGLTKGPKELHLLSRAFDKMFGRLESFFVVERQFASDVSHELRTPITVILAECDHARRKDKTADDFLQSIQVIEEQASHMSELVRSLLAMTRMQHGTDKYPMSRSDLSEFALSCCDEFIPADARGISLTVDVDPDIFADFNLSLMSRVIHNLLQNAYKYGRENGHIVFSLKAEKNSAVMRCADDGIGIAPENLDRVWQRFWQADASRSEDGGCGLGLAMVKEIAEFHGGSVRVESTLGQGSTFIVSIPLSGKRVF